MKIPRQPLDISVSWSKYLLTFWERFIVESFFQGVKISGEHCSNCLAFQSGHQKSHALPNMVIYVNRWISVINLVLRAFSSFKMAVGETPGQGCWNTPRIVEYFVTWHMMNWLFRRLVLVPGSPVCFFAIWNRCSNETKTFQSVDVTKF